MPNRTTEELQRDCTTLHDAMRHAILTFLTGSVEEGNRVVEVNHSDMGIVVDTLACCLANMATAAGDEEFQAMLCQFVDSADEMRTKYCAEAVAEAAGVALTGAKPH